MCLSGFNYAEILVHHLHPLSSTPSPFPPPVDCCFLTTQTDLLAEMEKEIVGLTERSEARKLAAARRAPQGRAPGILAAMAAAKAQQQDGAQQAAGEGNGAAEMEEDRMLDSREDEEMGGERSEHTFSRHHRSKRVNFERLLIVVNLAPNHPLALMNQIL